MRNARLCLSNTLLWFLLITSGPWLGPVAEGAAQSDGESSAADENPAAQTADSPSRAPLELDDPDEPLLPKRPRGEHDLDQLEALALFGAGRAKEHAEDFAGALRMYQRAFRFDPNSGSVLVSIVTMAEQLGHRAEADRYASLRVDLIPPESRWLGELGARLVAAGNNTAAIQAYQRVVKLLPARGDPRFVGISLEIGRLCYLAQQYAQSAEAFAVVMDALEKPAEHGLDAALVKALSGDSARSYELFADAFLLADRLPDARRAFDKQQELAPNAALHAYHTAQVEFQSGDATAALATLSAALVDLGSKRGVAPYELLVKILEKLGKAEEVFDRLEAVRSQDASIVPATYFLANRHLAAGHLAQAEALYAELIASAEPPLEAFRGAIEVRRQAKSVESLLTVLADMTSRNGDLDAVEKEVQALAADAALLDQLIAYARARQTKGDLEFTAQYAMASVALEAKRFDVAKEFFDLALQSKPESAGAVYYAWGYGLLTREQSAAACEVFQRGIDAKVLPEGNPAYHNLLALALALDDKFDRALAVANDAQLLGEPSARVAGRVPWVYYQAKRYDDAIRGYRELLSKYDSEQDDDTRRVLREARLALSNLFVLQGDMRQAEEWLEQVLDEFPEDVGAMNDLGYLWADQGKHLLRALDMVQKAVTAEPENVAYRDSLGWAFYRLGRFQEAVVELEKAAANPEADGVILDHLADAYLGAGRLDEALASWRKAAAALEKKQDTDKLKPVQDKLQKHDPNAAKSR